MAKQQQQASGQAKVAYVRKENAKKAKNHLKDSKVLDDRFRMLPAASGSEIILVENDTKAFIAIPVSEEFDDKNISSVDSNSRDSEGSLWTSLIVGVGYQTCPYSTKMMGNGRANQQQTASAEKFSLLQSVILGLTPSTTTTSEADKKDRGLESLNPKIIEKVLKLNSTVCPGSRKRQCLEIFGDDRTVVVPPGAFEGEEFVSILRDVHRERYCKQNIDNGNDRSEDIAKLYDDFWNRLALAHDSPRVVRRGGIDPNSKIRESGHRLLWPLSTTDKSNDAVGPLSPTWIRVTEQGVKQSFDLSKVMFSRGNISEKIRFGKQLVREGDVVLDMYTGIGYYTLPAVIHGKAAKVYSCEWNEHAVQALRYNVADNKITDKVEIFVGDCRKSAEKHKLVNLVDRVSLGLLPSSEGGWRTAIRALKVPSGGWLHVHANVPAQEMESWTFWLCHELNILSQEEGKPKDWWILCDHVERVKSFAPTVFHYVADVFVGIPSKDAYPRGHGFVQDKLASSSNDVSRRAWVRRRSDETWVPVVEKNIVKPSCALSPDGVLSQEWMR